MTKHWPEHGLLVLPSLFHLGEHHDHQLDAHRKAQQSASLRTAGRPWTQQPAQMLPQQPPRVEKADAHPEHLFSATATMDKPVPPGSSRANSQDDAGKQLSPDKWSREEERSSARGGKKKNYQRYPKPPYSYLAMIAMVIQRSPEKKLTLSEVRTIFKWCVQASNDMKIREWCGILRTLALLKLKKQQLCFTRYLSKRAFCHFSEGTLLFMR